MSIAPDLLKLAAKVALDRLIGDRTDEAIEIFQRWAAGRNKTSRDRELEATRNAASNPEAMAQAVNEVIVQAGVTMTDDQREVLALTVASGLTAAAGSDSEAAFATLDAELKPKSSKTYLLLIDDPRIVGEGPARFVHFFWDNESWRVRDYLGDRLLHPVSRTANAEGSLVPAPLQMSRTEIWNAGLVKIQSLARYGLGFGRKEQDRWGQILSLLTESAQQLRY